MRRRRLQVALVTLVAGLALVAAGCGGDGKKPSTAGELTTIADGVLTVGSDIPFPPFELREGDELTGFDVELVEELARRLGLEVKWIDTAFDTIFTQLAGGRFDVVASATTITEERQKQVNFTDPYYLAQQALTVNSKETPDIESVDDLEAGNVVAVQKGTTGEIWARENLPDGVEIRSFPEAPDTYTALEAGNVTGVVFDEPSALTEAKKRPDLEVVQIIDTGERYGFAVNPENEALLEALNDTLEDTIDDGTYDEIYAKYSDLPPGGSITQAE